MIHDFTTGVTTPVAGIPDGASIKGVSSDLDKVLYQSGLDLYVLDVTAGTTTLVTQTADGQPMSFYPGTDLEATLGASLSADGTHLAFWSSARNMAVGQMPKTTLDQIQVFVRDLTAGVTTEVDKTLERPAGPALRRAVGVARPGDGARRIGRLRGLRRPHRPIRAQRGVHQPERVRAGGGRAQSTAMGPSSLTRGHVHVGHRVGTAVRLRRPVGGEHVSRQRHRGHHLGAGRDLVDHDHRHHHPGPVGAGGRHGGGGVEPAPGPGLVPLSAGSCACTTISP